jgi:hypothetical protein
MSKAKKQLQKDAKVLQNYIWIKALEDRILNGDPNIKPLKGLVDNRKKR